MPMRQQDTESTTYSAFCDYRDGIAAQLPSNDAILAIILSASESEFNAALAKLPENQRYAWQARFNTGYASVSESQRTQLAKAFFSSQSQTATRKAA